MITLETDGLRAEGETLAQARANLRRLQKQAQEKARQEQADYDAAHDIARRNALHVFRHYFAKTRPKSWAVIDTDNLIAGISINDEGSLIINASRGAATMAMDCTWRKPVKLIDTSGDAIAVALFDSTTDQITFHAIGIVGQELAMEDLPSDVGVNLFYPPA